MNALEQARNLLAKQKLENERCTVEEVPQDPVAEEVTQESPGVYANTIILWDRITMETLILDGVLSHKGVQFANIINRTENLMNDIFEILAKSHQGVECTHVITNFSALSLEQFKELLAKYQKISFTFLGNDEEELVNTIVAELNGGERVHYTRAEGSLAMQVANLLTYRDLFATEDTYLAYLSNTEFQENLSFIAKNEYTYYKNKMLDFVNGRLLRLANPNELHQVFLPYKISQINRFTNNHCIVKNTIVADFSYNDVVDYVNYLTALTNEESSDSEKPKVYKDATALVTFAQNYTTNECRVTIISWTLARTAELRSRLGDCGHQPLSENVTIMATKFAGSQQEFINKYL